jgi:putative heme transporter
VSRPPPWLRRYGPRTAGVALVVALFAFVLPRIADYGKVWAILQDLDTTSIVVLIAAATLNILTFGPPWMAALPGLSFRHSLSLSLSSTAIANVAPGGDAVGLVLTFTVLRRWGFERARAALALVVFTVWNQLVNVAFPALAVVLLAVSGQSNALLQVAASIGGVVLVVVLTGAAVALRSEQGAMRVGELAQTAVNRLLRLVRRPARPGIAAAIVGFRVGSVEFIRRRWAYLTVTTLLGHLTVWLVLVVALRCVGVHHVSLVESFAAWSLVRLLTAIPTTPGGLGVVELGLTGALVGFGGAQDPVVAAVFLYRFLTFLPPIPLGLVLALTLRRAENAA